MTQKSVLTVLLAVVLAVLLASCTQGAAPTPTATKAPAASPAATTPAGAASGQAIFQQNCNTCHPGGDAGVGPSLKQSKFTVDQIKTQVRNGKGQMPPFPPETISDAQLDVLANYVKSLQGQ